MNNLFSQGQCRVRFGRCLSPKRELKVHSDLSTSIYFRWVATPAEVSCFQRFAARPGLSCELLICRLISPPPTFPLLGNILDTAPPHLLHRNYCCAVCSERLVDRRRMDCICVSDDLDSLHLSLKQTNTLYDTPGPL